MIKRRILAIVALVGLTTALSGAIWDCSEGDCEVFCTAIDTVASPTGVA